MTIALGVMQSVARSKGLDVRQASADLVNAEKQLLCRTYVSVENTQSLIIDGASSLAVKLAETLERTPAIFYFVILVLLAFVAEPNSFARDWNEGRSALLVIVPLALMEMGRSSLLPLLPARKSIKGYAVLAVAGTYYFLFSLNAIRANIVSIGVMVGTNPVVAPYSWVWALDYGATSIFLAGIILLIRGQRVITPLIYTLGMASFLFFDAVFPYSSLGPFVYVIPFTLKIVAAMVNLFHMGTVIATGNILTLQNAEGTMSLEAFWPSAGLEGIVIGLLAVTVVCVKIGTSWFNGGVYLLGGLVGSFLVNVLRIAMLVVYAFGDITDPRAFERFHSVAGELVFLPWIVLYIFFIIKRESRKSITKAEILQASDCRNNVERSSNTFLLLETSGKTRLLLSHIQFSLRFVNQNFSLGIRVPMSATIGRTDINRNREEKL